jgi:hypothetical protein
MAGPPLVYGYRCPRAWQRWPILHCRPTAHPLGPHASSTSRWPGPNRPGQSAVSNSLKNKETFLRPFSAVTIMLIRPSN